MLKIGLLITSLFAASVCANEYQEWLKSQQSGYSSYKKSLDEEFTDMLKKDWEAFNQMYNSNPFSKPKPKTIPKVKETYVPKKEIQSSPKVVVKTKLVKKIEKPVLKTKVKKTIPIVSVDFFSQEVKFNYDEQLSININEVSKQSIVKFWQYISKIDTKTTVSQIKQTQNDLHLNDWGVYQLVNKLADKLTNNNQSSTLVSWYFMTKLGFDTKIAYNKNDVYLLGTTSHKLYQVAFFKLDNKRYYVLDPKGRIPKVGRVYTYSGNYPNANNKVSMKISDELLLDDKPISKSFSFSYNNQNYKINSIFNENLVNFYSTYPQSDYQIYYEDIDYSLLNSGIVTQLSQVVENKSELEAVNILLRFVQTAFEYKTDDDQFRYEKVMFPNETLFYPYSDCEDRSIIFSYLVKKILGLEAVGIKYSDHMAAAVAFNSVVSGDSFKYKGKVFTMADPTYINANTGISMPKYKNKKFEIIGL